MHLILFNQSRPETLYLNLKCFLIHARCTWFHLTNHVQRFWTWIWGQNAWIWCWRRRSYFCWVLQSFVILDFSFETVQSFYLFQNDVFNLICYFFYSSMYEDCSVAFETKMDLTERCQKKIPVLGKKLEKLGWFSFRFYCLSQDRCEFFCFLTN